MPATHTEEDETLADEIQTSEDEDEELEKTLHNTTVTGDKTHRLTQDISTSESHRSTENTVVPTVNPLVAKLQSLKPMHRKVASVSNRQRDGDGSGDDLGSSYHLLKVQQFSDSDYSDVDSSTNRRNLVKQEVPSVKQKEFEGAEVSENLPLLHQQQLNKAVSRSIVDDSDSDSSSEEEQSGDEEDIGVFHVVIFFKN